MNTAISKAIEEAFKSEMGMRHGCVVCTKSGKLLSSGHNNYRTRVNGENTPCCHAEVDAIHRLLGQRCEKPKVAIALFDSGSPCHTRWGVAQ